MCELMAELRNICAVCGAQALSRLASSRLTELITFNISSFC
jgi:hypothetical protein